MGRDGHAVAQLNALKAVVDPPRPSVTSVFSALQWITASLTALRALNAAAGLLRPSAKSETGAGYAP